MTAVRSDPGGGWDLDIRQAQSGYTHAEQLAGESLLFTMLTTQNLCK